MTHFQVSNATSGLILGIYAADDEQGARDAVARDAGYSSEAAMVESTGAASELVAEEITRDQRLALIAEAFDD